MVMGSISVCGSTSTDDALPLPDRAHWGRRRRGHGSRIGELQRLQGSIRPEPKLSLRSPAPGGTTCATAANETLAIAKAAAMTRALASMLPDLSTNGRQNFTSGAYAEAIVAAGCQPPAFCNFSRCFNKVTPRNGFGAFRPRIGSRKAIRGRFDPRRHASQEVTWTGSWTAPPLGGQ